MNAAISYLPIQGEQLHWFSAELSQSMEQGWLLNDGRMVRVAASCLVQPQTGDTVLVVATDKGNFITQILLRADDAPLTLGSLEQPMTLQGDQLQLVARERLNLGSARDCDITAAGGTLSMNAAQMTTTVVGSWIQSARTSVCRFGDWAVNVRQLLKMHGKRQQLSADKELKVDADIIHMG